MSKRSSDESTVPLPRQTTALFGHAHAEAALLDGYRSGRMAHAWLIGGPRGIGKATLAYRMARFVLSHPQIELPAVARAASLAVSDESMVARQVASGAHGNLLTLERTANDKGVLRTVITVDESRETLPFFGATSAVEGWRICIVDTVDELNENAANALLKIIEEPPARALFLLVSHAPARLLPTIRSRCRKLMLRPLETTDVIRAAALAIGRGTDDAQLVEAANASNGSVGEALNLLDGDTLGLQQATQAQLERLPNLDHRALHTLGDKLGLNDKVSLAAFVETVERWMNARLHARDAGLPRLARLAEVWEKIAHAARETADYNLERKPLVFSVFAMLAEATR